MSNSKPDVTLEHSLRARPVLEQLSTPQYPTRGKLAGNGKLHAARWGKATAGAATFFLAISIGGCDSSQAPSTQSNRPAAVRQAGQTRRVSQPNEGRILAAPLFEHGDGTGATGCMVMSPPVFLSEEEAMQIIKEELANHRIELVSQAGVPVLALKIPLEAMWPKGEDAEKLLGKYRGEKVAFGVDAIDAQATLAVEYVSEDDCKALDPLCRIGTVSRYRTKEVATHLASLATNQDQGALRLGIFYDPLVTLNFSNRKMNWQESERHSKMISKRLLRQQVKDFVHWLDEQGGKKDG